MVEKVASDNNIEIQNNVVALDFKGLEKVVALFFPSIRKALTEQIRAGTIVNVERFRAETIANVGLDAVKLANENGIELNPIIPKMAMPLLEKMSLEHEKDMYDKWARLLVAASANFDPIQQQFIDILANIGGKEANLLKEIYLKQKDINGKEDLERRYNDYLNEKRYKEFYDRIERHNQMSALSNRSGFNLPQSSDLMFSSIWHFPYLIDGTDKVERRFGLQAVDENGNPTSPPDICLDLSAEQNNMLLGLKKLGLIEYEFAGMRVETNNKVSKEKIYVNQYGVLLTNFGYTFIDCLENLKK